MFDEAGYNECVVRTFRKNAVHTAMVIDDRFPTYADLARGAADTSRFDVGKAELVYQTFKNERIPCDIENDVSRLGEDFEHVRKSDLVVLDYHLRGSDSDSRDAIDILRKLQQSQHFNLVVLYTRDGALDNVWLRVASSLIGGWHKPSELMTPEAYDEWEDLANSEEFEVSKGALAAYILGDDNREERTRLAKVWHDNKRNPKATKDAINAAFHFAALKLTVDGDKSSGEPLKVAGRFNTTGSHWLQCGNVFVAFMQKKRDEDVDRSSVDPEGIMSCLDAALVDWRPNLLKVIISEIQNTLEQTGLAYAEDILRSPEFQAAWIYNVLKEATLQ